MQTMYACMRMHMPPGQRQASHQRPVQRLRAALLLPAHPAPTAIVLPKLPGRAAPRLTQRSIQARLVTLSARFQLRSSTGMQRPTASCTTATHPATKRPRTLLLLTAACPPAWAAGRWRWARPRCHVSACCASWAGSNSTSCCAQPSPPPCQHAAWRSPEERQAGGKCV
jgi:hypothetical protein